MSVTIESTQAVQSLLRRHLTAIEARSCGRGGEPDIDGEHDDAMAWSLYGRGYVLLARSSNGGHYREAVETCVRRILELSSPVGCASHRAWGLPYPWKEQPAHHPYGITTAMCGDFLLDAAGAGISVEPGALQGAVTWLTRGVTWRERRDEACPEFSPCMSFLATNVASRSAGFLLHASRSSLLPRPIRRMARIHALQAARFTLAEMHAPGYWFYGRRSMSDEPKPKVDNLHTAYVIEGLLRARSALHSWRSPTLTAALTTAIRDGMRFYLDYHFGRSPACERLFVVPDDREPQWQRKRPNWDRIPLGGKTIWIDPMDTRAWGVGAALTALAESVRQRLVPAASIDAIFPLALALETHPGHFGYRSEDPTSYVRHEAHLFFGLCGLLRALQAAPP